MPVRAAKPALVFYVHYLRFELMQIRRPLAYSMLLNGIFGGILGYKCLLAPRPHANSAPPIPPPALAQPISPVPEAKPAIPPDPFQWSTLESADYPTYMANLRNVGCPEITIRDIISADIAALYAQKRAALAAQKLDPATLYRAAAALQEEEVCLLDRLLGTLTVTSQEPVAAVATISASPFTAAAELRQKTALTPLVFQPVDPGALKLNDLQGVVLERIRQTFIEQIGGTNQNPNDPKYLERWQAAKTVADSQLKDLLGKDNYYDYQVESLKQARKMAPDF